MSNDHWDENPDPYQDLLNGLAIASGLSIDEVKRRLTGKIMSKPDIDSMKINLCDGCINGSSFPECLPDEEYVEYGTANGLDNIIKCTDYAPEV